MKSCIGFRTPASATVLRVQPFRKPLPTAAIFLAFIAACLVFATAAQNATIVGVDSIRADDLRQKLTYLASEKFKGRGNGTPELNMAADYIAGIFEKSGLKPASDNGTYLQHFDIYSARLGNSNALRIQTM